MRRLQAIEKVQEVGINNPDLHDILCDNVSSQMSISDSEDLSKKISLFTSKLKVKFKKHSRTYSRLIKKEKVWLDGQLYSIQSDSISARLEHTAKISRINVMKNQLDFMMCRTDPVISSITFKKHKNLDGKPLDPKVLALLKE